MRLPHVVLAALLPVAFLPAQDGPNYALAERFSSEYVRQRTYSSSVQPSWIGETDRFWYSYEDRYGWRYMLVEPAPKREDVKHGPLFDRDTLAAKLSMAVKQPLDAEQMRLSNAKVDDEGRVFSFIHKDKKFEYDLVTGELADKGEPTAEERRSSSRSSASRRRGSFFPGRDNDDDDESPTHRVFAPDNTAYVFARGDDLYFVEATEEVREQVAEITARIEAEEKAKEEADEKAKEEAEEGAPQDGEGRRERRGRRDGGEGDASDGDGEGDEEGEEEQDETKIETVRVRYLGQDPFPVETDERRKWADQVDERDALRLSTDGEEDRSFRGRTPSAAEAWGAGQDKAFDYDDYAWDTGAAAPADEAEELPAPTRPSVRWSPDSTAFYVTRRDSRDLEQLFLVNSIAEPRPELEQYDYPMPGEEKIRRSELHVFDRAEKALSHVEPRWKDEQYRGLRWTEHEDPEEGEAAPPAELRLLRQDRLVRNLEYVSLIPSTGATKVLLEEGFEAANVSPQGARYLEERDQFIWWSDRSGWGHFYLYDGEGKLLGAITSGKWRASRVVDVDEEKGLLFFTGNGREADQNIYYEHLYRVHLDGSGLECLDEGNASHRSRLSPSKTYIVDNCSRIDMAPVSLLRHPSWDEAIELEEMDLSRLEEAGWRMPETFSVKAADGVTDLFGNMWKPFDFNKKKRYPIIVEVYPGPQTEGVSHTFSSVNSRQQLAQVGFIVVQVGHRGGTPGRSKAYHSYGYFNLRDYGLEDKKVALEQLAERCPFIDIERVGLYGHSGGGFMTAAAMMVPPYNDFFKVGVSSAGNHDNNIYNNYWSERYHGLREVAAEQEGAREAGRRRGRPQDEKEEEDGDEGDAETRFEIHIPTTQELAANLKGNLLLVHGEIDNNVHPANTMRLVDALIKENKRFDLLIIPGARHGFGSAGGYFSHMRWEFFAEHLLGDHQRGADILLKD